MKKTLLITGGCGFIGSNFIRYMLERYPDYRLINFDLLTYAGNPDNLVAVAADPRYTFVQGDIADRVAVQQVMSQADQVIHFAAESHVDRSIEGPEVFVRTNVLGTQVLLECARGCSIQRFIHVSTDEVYGSLGPQGYFTEETPLAPNSPYSASKAGSDLLARAYHETFRFPVIITRCSNNYGPYQYPEKLIPLMINNALQNKPLPVYGDGLNVRDWLYVGDHCAAIDVVLHEGVPGRVYNIGGNNEWKNIDIVRLILNILGKSESLISYVEDRQGHDRRYAIDAARIRTELGWQPTVPFEQGIKNTIEWYLAHPEWIAHLQHRLS
jgi:dTDP-glucose 4,6-dehydratase